MSTTSRLAWVTVIFLTGVVSPAQEPARKAPASVEQRFAEYDRDRDGKLTRTEFPAPRIFEAADADRDGLLTLDELLAHFGRQPAAAPKAQTASPSIRTTLDIPYDQKPGVEPRLLSLDVHASPEAKAAPVMVYVHGGFWQAGDKSAKGHLPEFFCGKGFVFVTLNYRLAPAAKHPSQVEDIARAVAWVHDHIAEHGGDPAQIYLTGHSAGAHLVALLGTDPRRLEACGKPLTILRAVIPLDSAAMDIRAVAATDRRSDSPYRAAFGDNVEGWADASPLVHVERGKGYPPFQLVLAYGPAIANKKRGLDAFAAALRKAGTRAEVLDASSFREHQSLMTEFGTPDDPVAPAVLAFIEPIRAGKGPAGLGGERALVLAGKSAEEVQRERDAYRDRVVMRQFDKDRDGRITRDEMRANPFLFDRMDANQDGAVDAAELREFYRRQESPPEPDAQSPRPPATAEVSEDIAIGSPDVAYRDPEFLQKGHLAVFADENGDVWVGEIDPGTGRFRSPSGRDHRIDGPISRWSQYANGPEWGLDAHGPAIFFMKDNEQGTGQLWRAEPHWDRPRLNQLTADAEIHNWLCEPSLDETAPTTRVITYRGGGTRGGNVDAWIDEDHPGVPHAFTERAYLARFSHGSRAITWAPRVRAGDPRTTQVSLLDTETGTTRVLTDDSGAKYDPWLWHAPEFDGERLLCVNVDQGALAIYRDTARDGTTPWKRIATIELPADALHRQLKSCEPFHGGQGAFGRSWFTAQAGDDQDPDTSIWLLGFNPEGKHIVRRLDDGASTGRTARRLDPETLVGTSELFVYYTLVGRGRPELRLCRAGITPSTPSETPR